MMSWVYLAVSARPRRPSRATSQENLMKLERITTQPDPYEPFLLSQGIRLGDLLFISGQAGYADAGSIVEGGFRAQGERAFSNLQRALTAGGASLPHETGRANART